MPNRNASTIFPFFFFSYFFCFQGFDYQGTTYGPDCHWYRLDAGGKWSHKPGITRVTNLDMHNNEIQDPRHAAMGLYTFHKFMTSDSTGNNVRIDGPESCCKRLLRYAFTNCLG